MSAPSTPQTTSSTPDAASDVVRMVRRRDRATSWDAASRQTDGKRAALQVRIYELLRARGPMTHERLIDELAAGYGPAAQTPSGVRSRCSELVEAGWIADSGDRRRTRAGSPAIVWQALEHDDPAPVPEPREQDGWRQPTPGGQVAVLARADWEGVDRDLALLIVRAYLNPRRDLALLADERGEQ